MLCGEFPKVLVDRWAYQIIALSTLGLFSFLMLWCTDVGTFNLGAYDKMVMELWQHSDLYFDPCLTLNYLRTFGFCFCLVFSKASLRYERRP